ncbi:MAG TPA: DinB family protein [Thermoanaerobaculia bacterium]|nr:DinB family protein [Thermoanaerobaculia bacterium]
MTVNYFRRMFSYTEWANAAFLECIRGLTEEQYTREIPSSFPTIRDTLAHMIFAEWLWLRRWKGEFPTTRPEWAKETALEALAARLREIESERAELLGSLSDADVQREFAYRNMAGNPYSAVLGEQMAHVVNHGTYHRGQLATMIRQAGGTPPSTDLVNLYAASRK